MWDSVMTTLMTSAIGHPNLSLKAIGIARERNVSFCDIMFKVPLESAFVPQCDTKIRKMLFNSFYKLCLFLIPWHVQGIRQTMMASFFPQMISSHRLLRPHANELLPSLLLQWHDVARQYLLLDEATWCYCHVVNLKDEHVRCTV